MLPGKKKITAKAFSVLAQQNDRGPVLKFEGSINEDVMWDKIQVLEAKEIEMDVGGIEIINSAGGRGWVNWVYSINRNTNLKFVNCSRVFIDYVNTIHGFVPTNGKIESFQVPYFCEKCGAAPTSTFMTEKIRGKVGDIPKSVSCACGSDAEMDVMDPTFFKFLDKLG